MSRPIICLPASYRDIHAPWNSFSVPAFPKRSPLEWLCQKCFLLQRNLKVKAPLGFICQCKIIKINQSSAITAAIISKLSPFSFRFYSFFVLDGTGKLPVKLLASTLPLLMFVGLYCRVPEQVCSSSNKRREIWLCFILHIIQSLFYFIQ